MIFVSNSFSFFESRLKKSSLEYSDSLLKPGKKPKFVVHAAGDVGISGDGYRWRKYGQKMVKGNPHPRCMPSLSSVFFLFDTYVCMHSLYINFIFSLYHDAVKDAIKMKIRMTPQFRISKSTTEI